MLKSMTAFASCEKTNEYLTAACEIRSYNSRHLDIALHISHGYFPLEEKIKGLISSRIARGRIEASVQIRAACKDASSFEIDVSKAEAYYNALEQLKDTFDLRSEITLDLMVSAGIIRPSDINIDMNECWQLVRKCLKEAIDGLDIMRTKEGEAIARDFNLRLDSIKKRTDQIRQESSDLISRYQERLKERISILTNGLIEIDVGRVAQEAAFLADRCDISEEIIRADSHIKQFRAIMASQAPAGRKLNFLLQEFNREFNTMGSKAANETVSHIIVDVKSEIEKIREQVQNVE